MYLNQTNTVFDAMMSDLRENKIRKVKEINVKTEDQFRMWLSTCDRWLSHLVQTPALFKSLKEAILGSMNVWHMVRHSDERVRDLAFTFQTYRISDTGFYYHFEATDRETGDLSREHTFTFKSE